MKNQLTALCIAMPLLFAAAQSHAEYVFKFPMEEATGGTLPNGSIIIVKNNDGGVVVPPVVAEPDPLEPENPKCDPYLINDRYADVGKQMDYYTDFRETPTLVYSACKLKPDNNPSLVLRIIDGASVEFGDTPRSNFCSSKTLKESSKSCVYRSVNLSYVFNVKVSNSSYDISPSYVDVGDLAFRMMGNDINVSEIKKVVINNKECTDFRPNRNWQTFNKIYTCLSDFTLQSLEAVAGKPYIIEFYR